MERPPAGTLATFSHRESMAVAVLSPEVGVDMSATGRKRK